MNIDRVAVILYTFRDFVKTAEGFQETIEKIAGIGYRAIQISGMAPDVLPPQDIARRCNDLDITICATHEAPDQILRNPVGVAQRLRALGTTYTAYPFPTGVDFSDAQAVDTFLSDLGDATTALKEEGITLCYHNHALEFFRPEEKTIYQRIFEETPIQAELDTYWVQAGGANPLDWVRRLQGKIPLLHLKDMRVDAKQQQQFAEIGSGNIEFSPIIEAAEAGGCQWFIVEQDNCYDKTPFESAAESFAYIQAHLVSG